MRIYLWTTLKLEVLDTDYFRRYSLVSRRSTDIWPVVRLRVHPRSGEMPALGLLACISNVPFDTVFSG